jgi:hypothetical protein
MPAASCVRLLGMNIRRRSFRGHIEPGVWPGVVIAVAFLGLGLDMLLEPKRFSTTPAYGTLTQVFDIRIWGACYLIAAVLLGGYVSLITNRQYGVIAHAISGTITLVWLLAFIIRWRTDPNTTAVNVVSWSVFLIVIIRSLTLIPMAIEARPPTRGAP